MFVVALILLIVVALAVVAALFGGGATSTIDLGSFDLTNVSARTVFFAGMLTFLLFVVAVSLLRTGARRASARRADRKKVSELSGKLDAYRQEERESAAQRDAD